MRTPGGPRVRYATVACAAAVVLLASVVDPSGVGAAGSTLRLPGPAPDKWVHAGAYAVLALLLCHATRARTTWGVLVVAVGVAAYGFGIELVQSPLPARTFDLADAAANAAGAGLAALAWRVGRVRSAADRRSGPP